VLTPSLQLSLSVVWSLFNLYLLRNHRLVPPHIFTLVYNVLMTFCLIYFPTVRCCRLYDRWSWFACAYSSDSQKKDCLPIYSKILEPEVVGLACSFVVACVHCSRSSSLLKLTSHQSIPPLTHNCSSDQLNHPHEHRW
jgi:hypothetical protein